MSDHISGPRALADPIADITDVYAFPSPERPGRLVLVMNTLPFAKPSAALSDGLDLPVQAAPADRQRTGRPGAVRGGRSGVRVRLRVLRTRGGWRRATGRAGGNLHDPGGRRPWRFA